MPSKIVFKAYPAKPSGDGHFAVVFHLDGRPLPIAPRAVDVKTTAEALAAFDCYTADAQATGQSLAVCMRVADGSRAPNGFKAATAGKPFYRRVNV